MHCNAIEVCGLLSRAFPAAINIEVCGAVILLFVSTKKGYGVSHPALASMCSAHRLLKRVNAIEVCGMATYRAPVTLLDS